MSLRKTIKIYRVQKIKKYSDNISYVGAKKFANNCSLLFKMSIISGKRKKTPTENNEIAPGASSESG